MWHRDGSVELVKIDAKPFVVIKNTTYTLFYIEDMGSMTILVEIMKALEGN